MSRKIAPALTALAVAAALVGGAGPARAATPAAVLTQESSPLWWGQNGAHADLVMYYDRGGKGPITIYGFYTTGLGGAQITQGTEHCGTFLSSGAIQLNPGDYCFVRAWRSSSSLTATVVMEDGSGSTANMLAHTRTSLEMRDANDTTTSRAEVR